MAVARCSEGGYRLGVVRQLRGRRRRPTCSCSLSLSLSRTPCLTCLPSKTTATAPPAAPLPPPFVRVFTTSLGRAHTQCLTDAGNVDFEHFRFILPACCLDERWQTTKFTHVNLGPDGINCAHQSRVIYKVIGMVRCKYNPPKIERSIC